MLEAARAYWLGARRREARRLPLPARLDRRGVRLARRRRLVRRDDPLRSEFALFRFQGGLRPSRLGLGATPTVPGRDLELLQQLRPVPFPREADPARHPQRRHGKPLPVYGAGTNVRDWLYVEDHARALDASSSRGRIGEKYNVGGRNERRNIDVVRTICAHPRPAAPGRPAARRAHHVRHRPAGHDLRYAIDATKLEQELGWRAQENFDTGIEKTVRWYLDNEWWWRPLRDKVYAGERLGVLAGRARRRRSEAEHEGHHPGRRRGHAAASDHAGGLEAASAGLRQADDLLSAVGR